MTSITFKDMEIGKVFTYERGCGTRFKKISADRAVNLRTVECMATNMFVKCIVIDEPVSVTVNVEVIPTITYETIRQGEYFKIDGVVYSKLHNCALRVHDLVAVEIKDSTPVMPTQLVSIEGDVTVAC